MNKSPKEIPFADADAFFDRLRRTGSKIVQCHGTFDLLHPGHIAHLEAAKEKGDVLVVTFTDEQWVNKGPGRPYFNNRLRSRSLCALQCVDYVVAIPFAAATEAITAVKPHIYCKGAEYASVEADVTGNFKHDVETTERYGGRVELVGETLFSSTNLINKNFKVVSDEIREFCLGISGRWSPADFRAIIDSFSRLRVLVVGDVIIDRYTTVEVQGMTSKDRILSGRFLNEEDQMGGALAIFRHLKQFAGQVDICGIVGREDWAQRCVSEVVPPGSDLLVRSDRCTIVKQRFVEAVKPGKEISKLFAVNYIERELPDAVVVSSLVKTLEEKIGEYDVVLAADFGHGTCQDAVRELVQGKAAYLAVNCQTNSNNHGFNIIDRRWRRANAFSLDRTELALAVGRQKFDITAELDRLKKGLGAEYAWITRGEVETIGLKTNEAPCRCVPLEVNVIDTIGAGDAFFSLAALAAASVVPLPMATFIAQLAGAQAVLSVGNRESIMKEKLLKSGMSLLAVQ